MLCPKCNTTIDSDSKFCTSCGAVLSEFVTNNSQQSANTNEENNPSAFTQTAPIQEKKKKKISIGFLVGIIFIVIGIIKILTANPSISSTSFGADFYTYTYQGIVAVAELLAGIQSTLGFILVAIGSAISIYSVKK